MNSKLDFSIESKGSTQDKAFIMIHGWKGNKDSFKTIASLLKLESITWFFPEAPFLVEGDENKKTWSYQREDGSWEVKKPKDKNNTKKLKGKKKKVAKALSVVQDGLEPSEAKELRNTAEFYAREAKRSRKLKRIRAVHENDKNCVSGKKKKQK